MVRGNSPMSPTDLDAQTMPTAVDAAPAISGAVVTFCHEVEIALANGTPGTIPDPLLRQVLTAAVKAYAAKVEDSGKSLLPFDEHAVTATEALVTACAMVQACDLNLLDMAMWFRRPGPGE